MGSVESNEIENKIIQYLKSKTSDLGVVIQAGYLEVINDNIFVTDKGMELAGVAERFCSVPKSKLEQLFK